MKQLMAQYKDPAKALMAYNAGQDQSKWNPKYAQDVATAQQSILSPQQGKTQMPQPVQNDDLPSADSMVLGPPSASVQAAAAPATQQTAPLPTSPSDSLPHSDSMVLSPADQGGSYGGGDLYGPAVDNFNPSAVGAGLQLGAIDMAGFPISLAAKGADLLRDKLQLPPQNDFAKVASYLDGIKAKVASNQAYDLPLANNAAGWVARIGTELPGAMLGGAGAEAVGGELLKTLAGKLPEGAADVVNAVRKYTTTDIGTSPSGEAIAVSKPARLGNLIGRGTVQGAGSSLATQGTNDPTLGGVAESAAAGAVANPLAHGLGAVVGNVLGTPARGLVRSLTTPTKPGPIVPIIDPALHSADPAIAHLSAPLWEKLSQLQQTDPGALKNALNEFHGLVGQGQLDQAEKLGKFATPADSSDSAVQGVAQDLARTPGTPRNIMLSQFAGGQNFPGGRLDNMHLVTPQLLRQALGGSGDEAGDLSSYLANAENEKNTLYNHAAVGEDGSPNMIPMPQSIKNMVKNGNPKILNEIQTHLSNTLERAQNDFKMGRGPEPNPADYALFTEAPQQAVLPPPPQTLRNVLNGTKPLAPAAAAAAAPELNSQIPFRAAFGLKQGLQTLRDSTLPGGGAGNSTLGELIGKDEESPGYLQDLHKDLLASHPAYAQATNTVREMEQAKAAHTAGLNFPTMSPQDIKDLRNGTASKKPLTPAAQKWFTNGVVTRAVSDAQKAALNGSPALPLIRSYGLQDKLKAAAGHNVDTDSLLSHLQNINQLVANSKRFINLGLKPQSPQVNLAHELGPELLRSVATGSYGGAAAAAGRFYRGLGSGRTGNEQDALSALLFNPDINGLRALLAEHQAKSAGSPLVNKLMDFRKRAGQQTAVALPTAVGAAGNRPNPNALAPFFQAPTAQSQQGLGYGN
jgi:hypothetical protein